MNTCGQAVVTHETIVACGMLCLGVGCAETTIYMTIVVIVGVLNETKVLKSTAPAHVFVLATWCFILSI